MTSGINGLRPVDARSILDDINAEPVQAVVDADRYAALKSGTIISSNWTQNLITGLQIEGFVPAKIAILMKYNWHDTEFISSLLSGLIVDLRDNRHVISPQLARKLLDKQGQNSEILELLYACMLCHEREDVYTLDDLGGLPRYKLLEVITNKEELHSKLYLEGKLKKLAEKFPEDKDSLDALLQALRQDKPDEFQTKFVKFLDKVIKSQPEGVKRYCFEDLKRAVEGIPQAHGFVHFFQKLFGVAPQSLYVSLYKAMKTQDFYGSYLSKVTDLTRGLGALEGPERHSLVEKCRKAYENTLYLLADFKNMPCASKTLFALHHGLIRQEWMKINALFQHKKHQFCNCHAVKDPKHATNDRHSLWPLDQQAYVPIAMSRNRENLPENVVIFGNNWGSGHRMATQNIAEIVEGKGYHPVTIDLADDLLKEEDFVRQFLGWMNPGLNTSYLFNTLLQHRAFSILNFLKGSSTAKPADPSPDTVKKIVQRMLAINPSMIINTNSLQNEPVIKAASLLGLPTMVVNTDIDRGIFTRTKPPEYAHFKMGIPFPEEFMTPKVSKTEAPHQIEVVGPPTKQIYDRNRSAAEIQALRQELEATVPGLKIPRDKKLIIVTSGGNGAISPYPELIAEKYKDKDAKDIPFVVVVLCGKENKPYLYEVTNKIAPRLPGKTMQAFEFLDPEIMEKLYRVASYGGGVIGKAGGLTVFETVKCGTRVIVDDMPAKIIFTNPVRSIIGFFNWFLNLFGVPNQLPWEKINQEFLVSQGTGSVVHDKDEFYKAFEKMIQANEPVKLKNEITSVLNFSERLPRAIASMRDKAFADASLKSRQIHRVDAKEAESYLI